MMNVKLKRTTAGGASECSLGSTHSKKGPRQETHRQHSNSLHCRAIFLTFTSYCCGCLSKPDVDFRILLGHELIYLQNTGQRGSKSMMGREQVRRQLMTALSSLEIPLEVCYSDRY